MNSVPIVGNVLSAYGSYSAGQENAGALTRQARVAREQAQRDEEAQRRSSRQQIGRLAAAFAETGGGLDEGVLRQSTINAELDALNIRYGGEIRAAGLLTQAGAVKRRARLGAVTKLLSAGGEAYGMRQGV